MRSIDLAGLPTRAEADRHLTAVRARSRRCARFLLQNLRRDPASDSGWRWQMNLSLLGDRLDDLGGWPDLHAPPVSRARCSGWPGRSSDYITPEYAPAMRALFPRVQLVTIKNAGHWVHSDQPEVFLAVMRRFLHL